MLERLTSLVFRVFTSLIFIVAGAQHLAHPDAVTARLVSAPFGHWATAVASPRLLVLLTGGVLLAAGVALLLGLATRMSSLLLIAVLIPITFTVQVGADSLGPLFKNVAILGALFHFGVVGGGQFSVDALLAGRGRRLGPAGLLGVALGLALMPGVGSSTPVEVTGKQERVFFLVQQPSQLKAALSTGLQLLDGKLFPASEVEVLVCGPGVESLVVGGAVAEIATRASQKGVNVVACGLSLTQKAVDRNTLATGISVVENGFVHTLQRKSQGFISVEL